MIFKSIDGFPAPARARAFAASSLLALIFPRSPSSLYKVPPVYLYLSKLAYA